ncbi:MAG: FAD-dependent oxidoreductase [Burkholderiales bacterium]|nr:FAD-dependent oxidoreductase [Burkholderiales bacterium]
MSINRRQFIASGSAALAGAAAAQNASLPFLIGGQTQPLLAKGKVPRIVVCGGGWGGLTVSKYLRQLAPNAEVIMLERHSTFFSCPMSNKWLIDVVDTQFLTYEYLRVSERHGYRFIQCEILNIERDAKRVTTSLGWLDYDYLVLSPGIRYNYEAWFGNDRRAAEATKARFPSAYMPNAEHFALKRALHDFKGGEWVMNLPPPPQRCPPSPYERACLVAWWFKKHNIKGHITILDHKDGVRPIGLGFRTAFEELYKDIITYVPNAHVKEIDPFAKRIKTAAGDLKFDHAVLMAPHQAGDLAWKAGAIGNNAEGKPTGWAGVDPLMLNLKSDPNVYVIGDAVGLVSPQFLFYPKAGHVANQHGRIVAKYIAERIAGRTPKGELPDNLCYMLVNGEPREAIAVQFDYKINGEGIIEQTQLDDNVRRADLVREDFRWFARMVDDLFA